MGILRIFHIVPQACPIGFLLKFWGCPKTPARVHGWHPCGHLRTCAGPAQVLRRFLRTTCAPVHTLCSHLCNTCAAPVHPPWILPEPSPLVHSQTNTFSHLLPDLSKEKNPPFFSFLIPLSNIVHFSHSPLPVHFIAGGHGLPACVLLAAAPLAASGGASHRRCRLQPGGDDPTIFI